MSKTALHTLSHTELDALREAQMRMGRDNDPIFSAPATLWWVALAALLVPPLQYTGLWLGLETEGLLAALFAFTAALVLQLARPLEAVLVSGAAIHWVWSGLHLASAAGWIAGDVGALPRPW
jgi:hypothetical protein